MKLAKDGSPDALNKQLLDSVNLMSVKAGRGIQGSTVP